MTDVIKPGTRLRSAVGTTEVVVVHVFDADAVIECAGQPMLSAGATRPAGVDGVDGADPQPEAVIGKRYGGPGSAVEVLCVKGGAGPLAVAGVPLPLRESKPLPASD